MDRQGIRVSLVPATPKHKAPATQKHKVHTTQKHKVHTTQKNKVPTTQKNKAPASHGGAFAHPSCLSFPQGICVLSFPHSLP
jgi:hypothetical protein